MWDSRLIAKSLRTVPRNYTRPLPHSPAIERALRGTIYDPYVRRIAWEFLSADGAWAPSVPEWLSCPAPASPTSGLWGSVQRVLGAGVAGAGETDDEAVCPYAWSAAIHPLNCDIIWPAALDDALLTYTTDHDEAAHVHAPTAEAELAAILSEPGADTTRPPPRRPHPDYIELDTPEYAGAIEKRLIVERLMAQGGVRLAAVLNWIFVTPEEGVRARSVPRLF